jgi:hypothetical protein
LTKAEAQRAAEASVIDCRMMASAADAVRVVAVLAMPSKPVAVLDGCTADGRTDIESITKLQAVEAILAKEILVLSATKLITFVPAVIPVISDVTEVHLN